MRGPNICFYGKIYKFVPKLSILTLLIWSTGLEYQSLPSSPGKYICTHITPLNYSLASLFRGTYSVSAFSREIAQSCSMKKGNILKAYILTWI